MITPVIEEIENESLDSFTPEITLGQITQDIESEAIENSPETTSFEHYWNDCNNVPTSGKNRYILAASHGVVPDFSLDNYPYQKQTNRVKPTNPMLKQEAIRRKKVIKGLRHKKHDELVTLLNSIDCPVTSTHDIEYIIEEERKIREFFVDVDKDNEEEANRKKEGERISMIDSLRFLEAIFSDDVKESYRS